MLTGYDDVMSGMSCALYFIVYLLAIDILFWSVNQYGCKANWAQFCSSTCDSIYYCLGLWQRGHFLNLAYSIYKAAVVSLHHKSFLANAFPGIIIVTFNFLLLGHPIMYAYLLWIELLFFTYIVDKYLFVINGNDKQEWQGRYVLN